MSDTAVFAEHIPPSAVVRERLARVMTEVSLLKRLLPISVRREQEAQRLAKLREQTEEAAHAS